MENTEEEGGQGVCRKRQSAVDAGKALDVSAERYQWLTIRTGGQ